MIEVERYNKMYGDFAAVQDLSFVVNPGDVLGLVGPNGAGKTTTLRALAGILQPTSGTIRICGLDLATKSVEAKSRLAFIPDEPQLFDYLTVSEHLQFITRLYSVKDAAARIAPLLEELELTAKKDSLPTELSRGMKQKLAIACGLLHGPKVVIFDEPLTGLDPGGIRRMKEVMRRLARDGAALILSSHLLSLLEEVCTHVLILKDGVKVADGTMDEVHARFSGGSNLSLEEVFFRATDDANGAAVPPVISP